VAKVMLIGKIFLYLLGLKPTSSSEVSRKSGGVKTDHHLTAEICDFMKWCLGMDKQFLTNCTRHSP
jgi:hypothetical protein